MKMKKRLFARTSIFFVYYFIMATILTIVICSAVNATPISNIKISPSIISPNIKIISPNIISSNIKSSNIWAISVGGRAVSSIDDADISSMNIPAIKASTASAVSVSFNITDANGNPLGDTVVVIQGITDTSFSTRGITDGTGTVSFTLTSQKSYQYTIFKTGYDAKTNFFFVIGDTTKTVQLSKTPDGSWYSYYKQDGNIELIMSSSDTSTTYTPGSFRNFDIEINNIASEGIDMDVPNTLIKTVESSTGYRVLWWGSIKPADIKMVLTLKPNGGWISITSQNSVNKVCTGQSSGTRLDTNEHFDLSGSEFICIETPASTKDSEVPPWIPTDTYKMIANIAYVKSGVSNSLSLTTQDFYVNNANGWSPNILSSPSLSAQVGTPYEYDVSVEPLQDNITQDTTFFDFALLNAPSGMTLDKSAKKIAWTPTPTQQGVNNVKLRVKHIFFEGDPQSRGFYTTQDFNVAVKSLTNDNIYSYNAYAYNTTVNPNDSIIVQFKIMNNASTANAVPWTIDKGDGTTISSTTSAIPPYSETIVWAGFKYASSGTYVPKVIVDPQKSIIESNYGDNILSLPQITVRGAIHTNINIYVINITATSTVSPVAAPSATSPTASTATSSSTAAMATSSSTATAATVIGTGSSSATTSTLSKTATKTVSKKSSSSHSSTSSTSKSTKKTNATKTRVVVHYIYAGNDPSKKKDYYEVEYV